MNKKKAIIRLVISCIVLVVLLLTKSITPLESGVVFAVILLLLGLGSNGFTKKS